MKQVDSYKDRDKLTFELIFLVLLLILSSFILVTKVNADQLVKNLPVELEGDWSRCIYFESNEINCNDASIPYIQSIILEVVKQFVYKKSFIINSDLQTSTVGIWLDFIDDVDEVRINDYLVGSTGQFPPYFQTGFRHRRLYLIPSVILNFNQANDIEIRTFSSANKPGLGTQPVLLVDYFIYSHKKLEQDYVYIFCISTLLLLTLFQFLYFFMVRGSYETLYLALFLISFAFIAFTRSEAPIHIGLDLSVTYKTEMFILNLGLIGINLFIFRFFRLKIRNIYSLGIFIMSVPAMINIVYPNPLLTRQISEIGYFILCLASFLIGGSALYTSIIRRKKYYAIISTLFISSWVVMCFDAITLSKILIDNNYLMRPSLLPLTAVFLGIGSTLIITHKYWGKYEGITYDYNTGALLRPVFFQRLAQEVERSQKEGTFLLLAVIQIQEIKNIAVNYGKETSDKLLISASNIITNYLNPFDLVCFFDNGEFCIATTVDSKAGAQQHLNRLHHLIIEDLQVGSSDANILAGVKIGGVVYDQEKHLSISQLIQDANYGLEKAKTQNNHGSVILNNNSIFS